ncbi:hypothetical protein [Amycolatopsis sp.]|uniref:hypothetical protein n=1 Tax=Amycolatopsis sp. TaxID=37632 RepID=UPI00261D68E8|nr:hypothetical protein [Amycolatopsis sp.]
MAEITTLPSDADLPAVASNVTGEVIDHAEHNHQVRSGSLSGDLTTSVAGTQPGKKGVSGGSTPCNTRPDDRKCRLMGFSERARRVRDGRLAHGQRVAALCSCVSLYHPIGHRATLSFLAELAGPYQRHEQALLDALDALEASRAVWRVEASGYVNSRARQKRLGRHVPPDGDPPRSRMGGHWYAAVPDVSRRAAVHALKLWERDLQPGSANDEVRSIVRCCIATGGRLTAEQLDTVSIRRTQDEAEDVRWPMTLTASATGALRPAVRA